MSIRVDDRTSSSLPADATPLPANERHDATPPAAVPLSAAAGRWPLLRRARKRPAYAAATAVLALIVLTTLAGPLLPLADPHTPALLERVQPPFSRGADGTLHLAGTDQLGRDVLSRLVHGGRVSIMIALATMLLSGVVGSALGIVAGYRLGIVDQIMMRCADLQLAFPSMLLAIFMLYLLGPSVLNLVLLLSVFSWAGFARIARAQTLSVRSSAFVEGAVAIGCTDRRILVRHILPHLLPALTVVAVFEFAAVILAEAGLTFLGLGVQPPDASWGLMLAQGQSFITAGAWWLVAVPAGVIFLTTVSANLACRWAQELLSARANSR